MKLSVPSSFLGPRLFLGAGFVFGFMIALEMLAVATGVVAAPGGFKMGVVTSIPFVIGIIYGGYWLRRGELSEERYARIGGWWIVVTVSLALIVIAVRSTMRPTTPFVLLSAARWSGSIGGALGLAIGINEARAIERALVAERNRLRYQETKEKNEHLEEFASIVSHDLRNPLNVAAGRLQIAREECDSSDLDTAVDALERMEAIIEDTLTLARQGQAVGDTAPVDLADLARESWGSVDTADADLRIEESLTVEADRNRLNHVFENLFRNAVEHGRDDAVIRIGRLPDRAGFYVEDDGPGIPDDERAQVFETGYTTSSDGTGFGLSLVRRIAEAHGWDVRVTSGRDGGARFEFLDVVPAE